MKERILLRPADGLILGTLLLYTLIALVRYPVVEGWQGLVIKNAGVVMIYIGIVFIGGRFREPVKFLSHMTLMLLGCGYLFIAIDPLQRVIWGRWLDGWVLSCEQSLFGVQPILWLQQYASRPLTEWLMFTYVSYLPMFAVISLIVYNKGGERAADELVFILVITNIVCDLGFILFPVAGPFFHHGLKYSVPLPGYVWTAVAGMMRRYGQYAGGSIPSPHCANATVMWLIVYRYHRRCFWILAPIVLSLYVATFYGRFHYMSDAVIGIVVGVGAYLLAPALQRTMERRWRVAGSPG